MLRKVVSRTNHKLCAIRSSSWKSKENNSGTFVEEGKKRTLHSTSHINCRTCKIYLATVKLEESFYQSIHLRKPKILVFSKFFFKHQELDIGHFWQIAFTILTMQSKKVTLNDIWVMYELVNYCFKWTVTQKQKICIIIFFLRQWPEKLPLLLDFSWKLTVHFWNYVVLYLKPHSCISAMWDHLRYCCFWPLL